MTEVGRKLYTLSVYDQNNANLTWLTRGTGLGSWCLAENPGDADLILFAEVYASLDPYFLDVVRHPVFSHHAHKCVLYHIGDTTETLCRTVSPSACKRSPNHHLRRSFSYLTRVHDNRFLDTVSEAEILQRERNFLFSFVGDPATNTIRQRIFTLTHSLGLLRQATGSEATFMSEADREPFQKQYIRTILESDFVLCPRGLGPASMRLFEVMQLGRVPVIISDDWLPVSQIPWHEFSIFVPESDIESIPELLEQKRSCSYNMGLRAREIWTEKFSPQAASSELLNRAWELVQIPYRRTEWIASALPLCKPQHWRILAASLRRLAQYGNCAGISRNKLQAESRWN